MSHDKVKVTAFYHSIPRKKIKKADDFQSEKICFSKGIPVIQCDVSPIINELKSKENNGDLSINSFPVISPLQWRNICEEQLNVKYVKLFSTVTADRIFSKLEEIEYFDENLLKIQIFGKWHKIPRKQVSFGDSGLSYSFSGNCLPAKPWTPLILELKEATEKATNFKYNFVLVNRYKDGEDYIGEHKDDEKDLDPSAPIASLSFGQCRDFVLRHKDSRGAKATRKINPVKIELEHGSLLTMLYPTNNYWYHSLPVRKKALHPRINLTFRKIIN